EGRAGNIAETNAVAEFHLCRISTVFTTDTQFNIGAGLTSAFDRDFHQFTNSVQIDALEGVNFHQTLFQVILNEHNRVITAVSKAHLGKVIGSKGQEFRSISDPIRHQAGARNFDNGSENMGKVLPT